LYTFGKLAADKAGSKMWQQAEKKVIVFDMFVEQMTKFLTAS